MNRTARKLSRLCMVIAAGGLFASGPAAHEAPSAPGCLTPATWTMLSGKGPRVATAAAVLNDMTKRDVVLLGEMHDDDDHHRWQVQTLAALLAQRPNMVIGFEMFPRRVQPALDRWVAGELTVAQLLDQTDWDKVWKVPAELYLPLFQFARINRIPMLALNVDPKLNRAIVDKGWDGVSETEREGVGRPAAPPEAYRDVLFEVYRQHLPMRGKDDASASKADRDFRHFVESQTTWDRAMAEALARRAAAAPKAGRPLLVGVMGSGHIRFGHGVPHQLHDLGIRNVGTLLPVAVDSDCGKLRSGLADAVFALPPAALAKPEPPRLGIRLEQGEEGVRIAEVLADSLAERSGLKTGDRLLEVAGQPAAKIAAVTTSIRQQPGGSWLPMRVRRGDETLEVVVKFPARQ